MTNRSEEGGLTDKEMISPKAGAEAESPFAVHIFSLVLDPLVTLYTSTL
jgi:hypothetical protein